MLQVEVHCHFKNDRVVQWCEQAGIHVTAYAPLSSPQSMANSNVPNLLLVTAESLLVTSFDRSEIFLTDVV